MMTKLERIIERCKGSVRVTVAAHKDCYESVEQLIKGGDYEHYDDQERQWAAECIEAGSICEVHVYPDTPVGFCYCLAPTLDVALDRMIVLLELEKP